FEDVVGPGRNDHLRIRSCSELGWPIDFLKETCQQEQGRPVLAQLDRLADPNEELWPKSIFSHAPLTIATTHRMADEDVHRANGPLKRPGLEQDVGGPAPLSIDVPDGARLRRFSMSRLIHRIAIKTSGGERLAETKEILFRAGGSMSQQHNW